MIDWKQHMPSFWGLFHPRMRTSKAIYKFCTLSSWLLWMILDEDESERDFNFGRISVYLKLGMHSKWRIPTPRNCMICASWLFAWMLYVLFCSTGRLVMGRDIERWWWWWVKFRAIRADPPSSGDLPPNHHVGHTAHTSRTVEYYVYVGGWDFINAWEDIVRHWTLSHKDQTYVEREKKKKAEKNVRV